MSTITLNNGLSLLTLWICPFLSYTSTNKNLVLPCLLFLLVFLLTYRLHILVHFFIRVILGFIVIRVKRIHSNLILQQWSWIIDYPTFLESENSASWLCLKDPRDYSAKVWFFWFSWRDSKDPIHEVLGSFLIGHEWLQWCDWVFMYCLLFMSNFLL